MNSRTRSLAIGAGLFALGMGVGFAASQQYWFRWAVAMREQEVVGRANHDILTLSKWRTGSETEAQAAFEGAVDTAVSTVYASRKAMQAKLPESTARMFQLAKVYRTAFPPPANSQPSLFAALNSVEMPEARYCSPALQKIMATLANPPTAPVN